MLARSSSKMDELIQETTFLNSATIEITVKVTQPSEMAV